MALAATSVAAMGAALLVPATGVPADDASGTYQEYAEPEPLPACSNAVVLTTIYAERRHTVIQGVTRLALVGRPVEVAYRPSGGRVVARTVVQEGGYFEARFKRPSRPVPWSQRARYRVSVGAEHTPWTALSRRLVTHWVRFHPPGNLQLAGIVFPPFDRGRRVIVDRIDDCRRATRLGSVKPNRRTGKFRATLPAGPFSARTVTFIRLRTTVRVEGGRRAKVQGLRQVVVLAP